MAYMGKIIRVNREYTGSEWAKYDMLFRTCGIEKGDEVVGDQHHHLRKMLYSSHEKPTKVWGVSGLHL